MAAELGLIRTRCGGCFFGAIASRRLRAMLLATTIGCNGYVAICTRGDRHMSMVMTMHVLTHRWQSALTILNNAATLHKAAHRAQLCHHASEHLVAHDTRGACVGRFTRCRAWCCSRQASTMYVHHCVGKPLDDCLL